MTLQAHKLLHLPDPERTKLWLQSLFVTDIEASTNLPSLLEFYERVHWRWADTHPYLETEDFLRLVLRTFHGCRAVKVSDDHFVLLGLRMADEPKTAREMLARKQKRDLRRLQHAGEIDPPKTVFAQKLLDDPLLMRVRRDKTNVPIPGSYVSRTRRRGGSPETRERKPFGDEEPGFPGLSMKRGQARYKRELEEYEKRVAAAEKELKDAGAPSSPTRPLDPQPGGSGNGVAHVE